MPTLMLALMQELTQRVEELQSKISALQKQLMKVGWIADSGAGLARGKVGQGVSMTTGGGGRWLNGH